MKKVVVLFAMKDSVYNKFAECDVYDVKRNALSYKGSLPVIAHPPCRAWGRLRHFSKAPDCEKDLARWAVEVVRRNGGVLEHPDGSALWSEMGLPEKNERDEYGGFTIGLDQFWFGHRARKRTRLYIVGARETPEIPFRMGEAEMVIGKSRKNFYRKKEVTKRERSATPFEFAVWLINLAKQCKNK